MTEARGVPVATTIAAANIDERISIYDLLHNVDGLLIEDKGYIKPSLKLDCHSYGISSGDIRRKLDRAFNLEQSI